MLVLILMFFFSYGNRNYYCHDLCSIMIFMIVLLFFSADIKPPPTTNNADKSSGTPKSVSVCIIVCVVFCAIDFY